MLCPTMNYCATPFALQYCRFFRGGPKLHFSNVLLYWLCAVLQTWAEPTFKWEIAVQITDARIRQKVRHMWTDACLRAILWWTVWGSAVRETMYYLHTVHSSISVTVNRNSGTRQMTFKNTLWRSSVVKFLRIVVNFEKFNVRTDESWTGLAM